MASKNNPGAHDCHAAAEPDEPIFTLRADDATAAVVVLFWTRLKLAMREVGRSSVSDAKLDEAKACARDMFAWKAARGEIAATEAAISLLGSVMCPDGHLHLFVECVQAARAASLPPTLPALEAPDPTDAP